MGGWLAWLCFVVGRLREGEMDVKGGLGLLFVGVCVGVWRGSTCLETEVSWGGYFFLNGPGARPLLTSS